MAAMTSLAAQLERLATPQTSILDLARDKRSILFSPAEAAKYGRDVYFDIGRSGFDVLAKIDLRFAPYSNTLFGRASRDLQRAVEGQEVNMRLDKELEAFLLLLSPYLQKEAALKALEWLVYRYQVNDMNKRALLMCVFPYYESALFTRVLQVVALSGDQGEWQWLSQCQKSARPPPKLSIFTQWAKKQVFRNFVADYLKKMLKVHSSKNLPSIASSFFITTVLGGLGTVEVTDDHLASIVKSLPQCLASLHPHLVSGTYLIVAHLACNTHLAPNTLSAIVSLLLKTPPPTPELFQPCLLTLLALSHHQDLTGVPGEILAPLGEREGLLDYLQDLAREKSVAALVCPYILGCLSSLMEDGTKMKKKEGKEIKKKKEEEEEEEEEEDEEERKKKNKKKEEEEKKKEKEKEKRNKERKFHRLIKTLEDLVMSSSDAAKVIWSVLEGLSRHPGLLCIDVAQSLRSLERCHPEGHTQAIARLSALQNDAKCGYKYRKVLQALLLPSASNEPYCFTQLVHTNEVVRSAAAKGYLERLARGVGGTEEVTALHVKSMLCDECPAITELALGTPEALKTLTPSILARQCQNLIEKQGKGWKKVRKLSVAALCGTVVENGDARTRDMALSTCLPLVLVPTVPSDVALAKIILKSKIVRHSPFLGALVGCVGAEVPAETYSDRVWSAMPLVIAKLSATEKLALWGLLECQEEECQGGGRLVVALCLLHAALGTRGVKGEVAVSLGHRMVDGCLALLEDATNRTPPPAPRDWSGHRVSPQDIHTYIRQATRGDPPYDLLVTCVLRAASLFDLPPACTKSPFWTPMMEGEPGQGHLLLLVKVTRAALRLERSGVTSARDAILLKVFKECLGDPRAQLHFLALVWGWQAALPYSTLIDDTMQIWCLKLGVALLSRGTPLSWTLAPDSPLVPSLLSALTSHEGGVRRGAVECLGCLSAIPGGALTVESLVAVVKVVVDRAEEVIEDGSQLASVVRATEGSQGRQQQQATQSLLGLVVAGLAPQHIKAALLYTLSGATQPTILLNLIPLAKDLLAKTEKKKFAVKSKKKEEEEEEEEEKRRLDPSSSLCLLYILQRFTTEAAGVLETEAGWGVFRKALSSAHPCLSIHGEMVSPQSVLLEEVLTSKFLRSLSSEMTQARLWSLLVGRVTSSADPNEASRLRHALRRVTLDAEVIGGQIEALQLAPKVTSLKEARERRLKLKEDTAHQEAWQKLHLMMETLTVMADLRRPWLLVGPLFNVLHLTLTLDLSSTALIQQQVLSTLIHLLHKAIDELGEKEVGCVCVVSVEVVVKVVRASLSHDTQRRALLLLALAARIVPESVLHNMMSIFTFMGTSLLRRDDSYSFQVIHQTIQAIVPTLIKSQGAGVEVRLAQVCQVFVDALPDLPHHRRLPLFTQLADTLHPDANLWLLLALLADSHVMRSGGGGGGGGGGSGGDEGEDKHSLPQVIQFSLSVAFHFPASVQLRACIKLVALVSALPDDLDGAKIQQNQQQKRRRSIEPKKKRRKRKIEEEEEEEEEEMEEEEEEVDVCLLPLSTHTQRQIFYLKYTTMAMLGHLLANEIFVAKVYEVEQQHHHQEGGGGDGGGGGSGGGGDGGGGVLQGLFQHLLQLSMCLLQSVTSACHLHQDKPQGRLYTSLQRKVMEVVEGVTALLPPPALLRVTQGLLTSPVALVRLKGAELLAAKLMPSAGVFFRAADTPALQVCVGTLTTATANKEEGAENRQTYLFCLQLVIRYLASHTQPPTGPHTLQPTLDAAVGVVCGQGEDVRVVTQALLVVAEAVATLQVAAVGCLSRLMPTLLKLLSTTTTTTTTTTATIATTTATTAATTTSAAAATTTQLLATLTALHKVVNSLPQLLSPYLEELVCQVCLVKPPREATGVREGKVAGKLAGLREALVKNLEARVLVPQMSKAFQRLSRGESLWPLRTLVGLVEGVVEEVPGPTLPNHRPALLSLLTAALDIRHAKSTTLKKKEEEEEEEELSAVEGTAFTALSRLLLRLPEQDNIAIFSSLVTWATPQDPRRLLVFYRFSAHLATTYKVLFLAAHLADLLLTPAADLITAINDNPHVFGKDAHTETLTCALLTAILETLTKICAHDSIGFVTHERFHLLCAPLAALVGNEVGGSEAYRQRVSWHLSPCLARLALAGGDDTLWRKLTNLVLAYLKEESTRPQVTLGALEVFGGLVEALGEDYLRPLVADVIPSITEALESVNTDVESATRCLFSKMEGILGDTLRAYLDH